MSGYDELNPFAALLEVMTQAELVTFQRRLQAAGATRTAAILGDEITERGLPQTYPPECPHYLCPNCGRISYNSNDIKHRYCGHCHTFGETGTSRR